MLRGTLAFAVSLAASQLAGCGSQAANSSAVSSDLASIHVDQMFGALNNAIAADPSFLSKAKAAQSFSFKDYAKLAKAPGSVETTAALTKLDSAFPTIGHFLKSANSEVNGLSRDDLRSMVLVATEPSKLDGLSHADRNGVLVKAMKASLVMWHPAANGLNLLATTLQTCMSTATSGETGGQYNCQNSVDEEGNGDTLKVQFTGGGSLNRHTTVTGTTRIRKTNPDSSGTQVTAYSKQDGGFREECAWAAGMRPDCVARVPGSVAQCYQQGGTPKPCK